MEKIQPKLRFPEFKEDWKSFSFRDFIKKIESGWSPVCLTEPALNGDWGSLKTTSISWNGYFPEENKKLPASLEPRPNTEVNIDDILITRVGPFERVGVVAHVNKPWKHLMVSDNMFRLKLTGELAPAFVPIVLGSSSVQNSWKQKIAGLASAQVVINQQTIFSTILKLPSLSEQTKIASFLSAVDEKINLLKEKKAALEEYKKGMMQKIFSQEIRFKDENGNDFAEWEEKSLGDCLDYEQPTPYLVSSTDYDDSFETPVLTAGKTFILGYTNEKFGVYTNYPVIIFDDFTTATQFVDFPFKAKSSAMKILKTKGNDNIKFLYEAIQMINFEIGGHGRHWISVFSVMEIPIPCLDEQIKIASFFSAIDEKIVLISKQIDETQEYKKGLLQQMFC